MDHNNRSSKLRQSLINAIIEEFSKVDPNTGDIPELEDLWKRVGKIYDEDTKMILEGFVSEMPKRPQGLWRILLMAESHYLEKG